jgi:hypothetical protein
MFGMLENLTKAAVAIAVSPIALAADIAILPATAFDDSKPFGITESVFKAVADNVSKAIS